MGNVSRERKRNTEWVSLAESEPESEQKEKSTLLFVFLDDIYRNVTHMQQCLLAIDVFGFFPRSLPYDLFGSNV